MQPLIIAFLCFMSTPGIRQEPAWQQFASAEGKFSATMPTEPKISTLVTNTREGTRHTHMVSSTDDNLNEFTVSWTEYENPSFEQRGTEPTFNKMRDALVAFNKGKVLSESIVSAGGHPARAIKFSRSDGRITTVRFYFIGNRFYQVMAQTRPENTDAGDKFFESFKLMPGILV